MVSSISFSLSSTRSMGLLGIASSRHALEGHVERGAVTDLTRRPHPPAMPMNDPLYGRESDPVALELLLPMKALEHAEQFPRIAAVEASTVVLYVDDHLVVISGRR